MIYLVFTACLISSPDTCRTVEIPVYEVQNADICTMMAIPTLAEWRVQNPDYRVKEWKCLGNSK